MRVQEAKGKTGNRRRAAVEAADVPENIYPTTSDALRDLARYLEGQGSQPDSALQMEDIMQGVNAVLDDELVSSYEEVMEQALFQTIPVDDESYTLRMRPAYELLKKLRALQKTRLRDAIGMAVRVSAS